MDWANGGLTNIDDLAFACPKDNKLVKEGGWTTRKNIFGETEWIPPAHLDVGQPRVNDFHHPERLRRNPAQARPAPDPAGARAVLPHNKSRERPGHEDADGPRP